MTRIPKKAGDQIARYLGLLNEPVVAVAQVVRSRKGGYLMTRIPKKAGDQIVRYLRGSFDEPLFKKAAHQIARYLRGATE